MQSEQLLRIMGRLDQRGRLGLYIRLALELTVRAREAYFHEPENAKENLRGLNELIHSVLGHVAAIHSNSPRTPDDEFAAKMLGFAQKLGVGTHLSLALDVVAAKVVSSASSPFPSE